MSKVSDITYVRDYNKAYEQMHRAGLRKCQTGLLDRKFVPPTKQKQSPDTIADILNAEVKHITHVRMKRVDVICRDAEIRSAKEKSALEDRHITFGQCAKVAEQPKYKEGAFTPWHPVSKFAR